MARPQGYEVLLRPLVSENTYGDSVGLADLNVEDITVSVGNIKESIDNGDFDFGVYTLDSINIRCMNINGELSLPLDGRSIFNYSRDKTIVFVNYYNGYEETATTTFVGIIDDRATRENFTTGELTFKVLALGSIFTRLNVPYGLIAKNDKISTAIKKIMGVSEVASILDYDSSDASFYSDYPIDDPTQIQNLRMIDAITQLLIASNSTLLIDKNTQSVIIRPRGYSEGAIVNLYGSNNFFNQQNIISIKNFNNGLHRTFNAVRINSRYYQDITSVRLFGNNTKEIQLNFITNRETIEAIAVDILSVFRSPKIEVEVEVDTDVAKDLSIFHKINLHYLPRLTPVNSNVFPTYGDVKYSDNIYYPRTEGSEIFRGDRIYSILGKSENIKKLTTTLFLREQGIDYNDGYID